MENDLHIRIVRNDDNTATLTLTGPEGAIIMALAAVMGELTDDPADVMKEVPQDGEDIVGG